MICPFWKCRAAIVLAACCCLGESLAHADDAASISLEEITRRVTEWRASFVNVRLVWELRGLPETTESVVEWPDPPDPESAEAFNRTEWIWADHGLDLLEQRSLRSGDDKSGFHSIEAFNGPEESVFRAMYETSTDGTEKFKQLDLLGLGRGKPISAAARTPLTGLYWPGTAQWLPELLSEWKWKVQGIENVGGESCVRITANQPYITDADFGEILWLDLNHDCLVRRRRSLAVAGRRAGRDFIVDEFQRLDGAIWFPKRGRLSLGGMGAGGASMPNENQIFIVTEAEVNQSLDPARFRAPAPAVGTVVVEGGRSRVHGEPPASARAAIPHSRREVQSTAGDRSGMARSSSAGPRPSTWMRWSAALAGASVIFFAVGFWFSHRKRED